MCWSNLSESVNLSCMKADQYRQALGKAIRKLRLEKGFTQEDAAHNADLHVNYFAGIERAEINTSINKLVVIASALDVSPAELLRLAEQHTGSKL